MSMQSNVQLISAFVFTTQIVQYLFILNQNLQASCHLLWLYSSVCVQPGWKPELDLMYMKHYAPNRCLYIMVAKLRTGVGNAETPHLQNCSVIISKENCRYFNMITNFQSPNLQREIMKNK